MNLFAYGTYRQYLENTQAIIPLTTVMDKKLKHLTILTLATQKKTLPYDDLMVELDLKNVRHLEDIIIEAIYAGKNFCSFALLVIATIFNFRANQREVGPEESPVRDRLRSCSRYPD
jgi:hypothetical protein